MLAGSIVSGVALLFAALLAPVRNANAFSEASRVITHTGTLQITAWVLLVSSVTPAST